MEIRIISHLTRKNNLTTRHTWTIQVLWVTTFRINYQRVESGPPYPSAVFHVKTSLGSPCMARTLSQWHPWSTAGCRPTQRPSKLLSLRDPINLICISTQLNLVHRGQTIGPESTQAGDTTLELWIRHQTTLNLFIQYSPLSPNCPARSHIKPLTDR
jgi:hypothetical protein